MPVPASQYERPAPREHLLDALRHDELRRPLAVRRVRARERPVRRKQPLEHVPSVRGGSPRIRLGAVLRSVGWGWVDL